MEHDRSDEVLSQGWSRGFAGSFRFSDTPHSSEYHTQLAKMSFDEIFDLTAGVYFNFYNSSGDNAWISFQYRTDGLYNRTKPNEGHEQVKRAAE